VRIEGHSAAGKSHGMAGRKDESGPQAEEVAAYVATMALELKALVEPHDMKSLAYLLDLVRLEAEQRAVGKQAPFTGTPMGTA
jgi:hypothetical protein